MCGIAGFLGEGNSKLLHQMSSEISHRGPDNETYYIDEENKLFLAHRRLSIVDINNGDQPMFSNNKKVILIFNGEIFNSKEIKKILIERGLQFKSSHSDTETLLNSYLEWGTELNKYLNGMWAYAIYNKNNQKLFLSKDRVGEKPLYYFFDGKNFAFSSEINSLLIYTNNHKIDELNLEKYFCYGYLPKDKTFFKNIYKLEPGSNLEFDTKNKKITIKKYWNFLTNIINQSKSKESELIDELDFLLQKSLKKRIQCDVPVGLFLSGGVDSLALLFYKNRISENKNIKTFTLGFDESSFDESKKALKISNFFNTANINKTVKKNELEKEFVNILNKIDEPFSDSSIIPTYFLCRFVKKYIKVAISGDGGDELFAGYDPFKALKFAQFTNLFMPSFVKRNISNLINFIPTSHQNMSFDFKLKRFVNGINYAPKFWNAVWMSPVDPFDRKTMFPDSKYTIDEVYSEVIETWDKDKKKNIYDRSLDFYSNFYLPGSILPKIDRASMLNSIEVRSIFFDKDILEYALKLPVKYKFNNGNGKYILKKLLKKYLPKNLVDNKKKGFGMPISSYFQKINYKMLKINNLDYINQSFVKQQHKLHKEKKIDNKIFLWSWLSFIKSKSFNYL